MTLKSLMRTKAKCQSLILKAIMIIPQDNNWITTRSVSKVWKTERKHIHKVINMETYPSCSQNGNCLLKFEDIKMETDLLLISGNNLQKELKCFKLNEESKNQSRIHWQFKIESTILLIKIWLNRQKWTFLRRNLKSTRKLDLIIFKSKKWKRDIENFKVVLKLKGKNKFNFSVQIKMKSYERSKLIFDEETNKLKMRLLEKTTCIDQE